MINGSHSAAEQTVFIVDDDVSVRTSLERLFRANGWKVKSFASAEEFLRQDLHHSGGCLIADVHLGRMNGFDLLQALFEDGALPVSVILTSGVDDVKMEIEARRLGAEAFFRKPFDIGALLDSVRRGLQAGQPRQPVHVPPDTGP
jgi:FixJ family two-component response regulator